MSVSWHWWHSGPHIVKWVVGLHHVRCLEAVSPSNHVQLVVYHRHAKLQPPPVHGSHLDPSVGAQVVLLDGGGAWSHIGSKTFKRRNAGNTGGWMTAVGGRCTFGGIHSSYSVQCAHCRLSGFGPWALEHGAPLGQKMVLHGLHQQLLAFQIIGKHLVVF